jgi:dUTP pyrophosphatase
MKYKRLYLDSSTLDARKKGDAGYDLKAYGDYTIPSKMHEVVNTGIAVEIPEGWVGLLFGRSGHRFKFLVDGFGAGVIDESYRGEVRCLVYNYLSTPFPFEIKDGDRFAHLVVVPYLDEELEEVAELSDTSRGSNGFGSTGLKEVLEWI